MRPPTPLPARIMDAEVAGASEPSPSGGGRGGTGTRKDC